MRWHYTVGEYLGSIYRDGLLYPELFVLPGVRPIVWFTSSPVWEEMANKGYRDVDGMRCLTREETAALGGGLFRLGVSDDYSLHPYNQIMRESKMPKLYPQMARAVLDASRRMGSDPIRDWWGTFRPVPREHWKTLEHFTNESWQLFTDVEKIVRGETGVAN
jgi:hypothetical protein